MQHFPDAGYRLLASFTSENGEVQEYLPQKRSPIAHPFTLLSSTMNSATIFP
jgi:hypothetical protein